MQLSIKISKFLILSIFVCVTAIVFCDQDVNRIKLNKPRNQQDTTERNLLNKIEDSDVEDDDDESANKFNYRHHQDHHAHYAGRSLMSTDKIGYNKARLVKEFDEESENTELESNELDPLKTVDYAEKEWQLGFRYYDIQALSGVSPVIEILSKYSNFYNDVVPRINPECRRAIDHIGRSMRRHRIWALQMMDSIGKIPSGITYGRFASPGDYKQCLAVKVDEHVYENATDRHGEHFKFHGKYCLIDFRLPLPERPTDKLLGVYEPVLNLTGTSLGKNFPAVLNYSAYASVFYEIGYLHGFCIPSVCDIEQLTRAMEYAMQGMFLKINTTVDCEEILDEPLPLRFSQVLSMFLFSVVIINAILASIVHYKSEALKSAQVKSARTDSREHNRDTKQHDEEHAKGGISKWCSDLVSKNKFYSECFSIQRNFERLTKPDPRGLTFVHYTRIVAMGLTVITHTAGMGTLQAIIKPADTSATESMFRDFIPQMLANAFTSIQIFFFMAGFMLVISTYPSIKRDKGHISFLEYAIKRAIRLLPGLTATIGLNFLWPLVVEGPMLSYFVKKIVDPCETNWWHTMGFMSNFDHVEKMCLRHSYFSASDYQLHIMSFPVLILLYKKPSVALAIAGVLTVAGFVAQVLMVLTKTVLPFMMIDYIDKAAFFNVVHYIHHPVWNHMSAFFYGFIIGYLVVKQIRIELSEKTIKRTWWILLPLGIGSIYAPYYWNHFQRPIYKWQMIIYVIVDRLILLTTCAWVSYASMVLARKPAPKPAAIEPRQAALNSNLPNIVTLDQEGNKKQQGELDISRQSNNGSTGTEEKPKLAPPSGGSIKRQRSSPDFQNLTKQYDNLNLNEQPINRAASSVDISKILGANKAASDKTAQEKNEPSNTPNQVGTQTRPTRSAAPVSNVNTLCLVLSRLTFQLYLFNMLVLWVDVNHSKYNWYFSYYFIFMKSFCVYIYSSVMAIIFFILLESPSLTLYIAWVRSRAMKRANRTEEATVDKKDASEDVTQPQPQSTVNQSNQEATIRERMVMTGMGDKNLSGSFDGLCMKSSKVDQSGQPTFSFIDLSSSVQDSPAEKTITDDQTKM